MAIADVLGGVPVISVMGTPRTIGETIGTRLRSRLQVLAQYLLEQLAAGTADGGGGVRMDRDDVRRALRPSMEAATRLEPGVWMEIESMARAAELPPEDLLLIHGYGDIRAAMRSSQPSDRTTFVSLTPVHTDHGQPRMALAWHLDPALLPYVTLIRRLPSHGPGNLTLTLAGLGPVAGLSEAGVAVAGNEMRVVDGAPGHLTPNLVAAAVTAPSRQDAERRIIAGPRLGGACIHLLDHLGGRSSLELSGRLDARLPDPWPQAPRVHCNQPLAERVMSVAGQPGDATSPARLQRIAAAAVTARAASPRDVAVWFRMAESADGPREAGSAQADGITPESTVLMICDPAQRTVHLKRGTAAIASSGL